VALRGSSARARFPTAGTPRSAGPSPPHR